MFTKRKIKQFILSGFTFSNSLEEDFLALIQKKINYTVNLLCLSGDNNQIISFFNTFNLNEYNKNKLIREYIKKNKDSAYYIYKFVIRTIPLKFSKEDIDKLTKAICETNDHMHICLFAEFVKCLSRQNLDELTKKICETKTIPYICFFAKNTKNLSEENLDELTRSICEMKNAEYIYLFSRDVKKLDELNMSDLTKAICKTKNVEYIAALIREVENLSEQNKLFIKRYILKTGDIKLICKYALEVDTNIIFQVFKSFNNFMVYVNLEYPGEFTNNIDEIIKDSYVKTLTKDSK